MQPNQLNSYDKKEIGDDHQHDIKGQVNVINVELIERSHHVQTNK